MKTKQPLDKMDVVSHIFEYWLVDSQGITVLCNIPWCRHTDNKTIVCVLILSTRLKPKKH